MLEPVERERRTRHVAQHVLEALAVTPVKRDLSVDVDAADLSERAVDRAHGAHGLHELERALAGGVADELHVSGRGRVAGGKYRLIVRQLSRLVAEAVERAAVRAQHANNARVRPRGNLLHLLEGRRAERVQCFPGAPPQTQGHAETERRIAALDERHRAYMRVLHAGQIELRLGAVPQRARHCARERGEHLRAERAIIANQDA